MIGRMNPKLSVCFPCFEGHPCNGERRLPRKKKKLVKKLMRKRLLPMQLDYYSIPCSCDLGGFWRAYKREILLAKKNMKYEPAIEKIVEYGRYSCDQIHIKPDLSMHWCWEYDNGLYTETGTMPFKYVEDPKDDTWAFEATKGLVRDFGFSLDKIQSDRALITAIMNSI